MTEKTTGARSFKKKEQDAPASPSVNWTKWGTVIGIVALSLTLLYATFEIAEWKSRVDNTVNALDGFAEWKTTVKHAVDSLDGFAEWKTSVKHAVDSLDGFAEWKTSVNKDLESIKDSMEEIKRALGIRNKIDPDGSPSLQEKPAEGF